MSINNQYKLNKRINPDKKFFDFTMRTRVRYYDEKIIAQCLDESKDIYRIPKNPKVVIDVGANIGCISLLCAKKGANIVYAFEPCLENFEVLQYNVKVNGFQDKIHCINKGVGKSNDKTKLYIHPTMSGTTSSYLIQRGLIEERYQTASFISIKDVFKNYNIEHCDLLKLDCEGGEKDIIEDFDDELANKVNQISVEFHHRGSINRGLVEKLSAWYEPEYLRKHEWVFRRKKI